MSEVCVGADLSCFYKETASDLVFFLPESRNTNDYPALMDPTPQSQDQCVAPWLGMTFIKHGNQE